MNKYKVTLQHLEGEKKEFQHIFEAEDLDNAWIDVHQFCSQWHCKCVKLELAD